MPDVLGMEGEERQPPGIVNRSLNRDGRLARLTLRDQASGRRRGQPAERCRTAAVCFRQPDDGRFEIFQGPLDPCQDGQIIQVVSRVTRGRLQESNPAVDPDGKFEDPRLDHVLRHSSRDRCARASFPVPRRAAPIVRGRSETRVVISGSFGLFRALAESWFF